MDIWSPRRERALFIHIPKTAGMTIRAALASQYALEDIAPAEDWNGLRPLAGKLDSYKLFVGHFRYFLRRLLPTGTKAFTFLREPVDRTISHLKHLASDPNFHELHEHARGRDLRALAQDPVIMSRCANVMVGYLSAAREGVRDTDLLSLDEENCCGAPDRIDDALGALSRLDFVGFVDDLDNDFARLCELLNLHPPLELPKINAATERHDSTPEGLELREIVQQATRLDSELYVQARQMYRRPTLTPRPQRLQALLDNNTYGVIERATEFPMSGPLPGNGFWPQERHEGRVYRWTGPQNNLTFEFPTHSERSYALTLHIFSQRVIDFLNAFVDGLPSEYERIPVGHNSFTLRLDIPRHRLVSFSRVTLSTFCTVSKDGGDTRSLGFVIVNMTLQEYLG